MPDDEEEVRGLPSRRLQKPSPCAVHRASEEGVEHGRAEQNEHSSLSADGQEPEASDEGEEGDYSDDSSEQEGRSTLSLGS